ncbi:hypothetical protein HPB48_021864 [Haemaphysalis longicornis]|uniref:ABC transmembrane type-1 domain-containing protein n=1 Tax=Haemaphysalis longicornis TaxID=44386 RepID=A0A9J6FMT5_HAELO|nr:hypothetical protein HPB48_021864 [Haemaphysalis longicornis]
MSCDVSSLEDCAGLQGISAVALRIFGSVLLALSTHCVSTSLHNDMLNHVLQSPVSFFDASPRGRILNRFSSDIEAVDSRIFLSFKQSLQNTLITFAKVAVVGTQSPVILGITLIATIVVGFGMNTLLYLTPEMDPARGPAKTSAPQPGSLSLPGMPDATRPAWSFSGCAVLLCLLEDFFWIIGFFSRRSLRIMIPPGQGKPRSLSLEQPLPDNEDISDMTEVSPSGTAIHAEEANTIADDSEPFQKVQAPKRRRGSKSVFKGPGCTCIPEEPSETRTCGDCKAYGSFKNHH